MHPRQLNRQLSILFYECNSRRRNYYFVLYANPLSCRVNLRGKILININIHKLSNSIGGELGYYATSSWACTQTAYISLGELTISLTLKYKSNADASLPEGMQDASTAPQPHGGMLPVDEFIRIRIIPSLLFGKRAPEHAARRSTTPALLKPSNDSRFIHLYK